MFSTVSSVSAGERIKLTPEMSEHEIIRLHPKDVDPSLLPLDSIEEVLENTQGSVPEKLGHTVQWKRWQSRLTIKITIPGVKKKDINLKMHEDSFSVFALRKDIDYTTALSFCCPVKTEVAKAKYENGLLRIEVPFKGLMEAAVKVPVEWRTQAWVTYLKLPE